MHVINCNAPRPKVRIYGIQQGGRKNNQVKGHRVYIYNHLKPEQVVLMQAGSQHLLPDLFYQCLVWE